jgi:hypothetical protein
MNVAAALIPLQTEGEQNDISYHLDFPSQGEAHNLFMLAKNRLKDIGDWHKLTGPGSSTFAITDTQGNETYKIAEKGDHFYIDMPGPGSIAGSGLDWVRIEAMDEKDDSFGDDEYLVITVRPVGNPRKPETATAHFFSHHSTNTFIVERSRNRVTASVHGRNESPNTDGNLIDKARNAIVGLTARHGLSAYYSLRLTSTFS